MSTIRGIYLNNRFYDYETNSYRENYALKNSSYVSNYGKSFDIGGASTRVRTLTILLWNRYYEKDVNDIIGVTTWMGASRLADLKSFTSGSGSSMPLVFVSPEGVSSYVIPTGDLSISIDNPNGLNDSGVEFRVSITLEDITT